MFLFVNDQIEVKTLSNAWELLFEAQKSKLLDRVNSMRKRIEEMLKFLRSDVKEKRVRNINSSMKNINSRMEQEIETLHTNVYARVVNGLARGLYYDEYEYLRAVQDSCNNYESHWNKIGEDARVAYLRVSRLIHI